MKRRLAAMSGGLRVGSLRGFPCAKIFDGHSSPVLYSCRMVHLGSALILLACTSPAAKGEEYCAACMEKAMGNLGDDTLTAIETAWHKHQQVLEALRKIEASGTDEMKAKAKAFAAQAEEAWRPYESLVRNYASPEYAAQLDEYQAQLTADLEQTKERIHRETDLYAKLAKTTLEEQRQRVLNDIAGFEKESNDLKKTFKEDCWLGAFSAVTAQLDMEKAKKLRELNSIKGVRPIKNWDKILDVFVSNTKKKSDLAARTEVVEAIKGGVLRNGKEARKAFEEGDSAKKMAATVQLVSDTGLTVIRAALAAKPALAAGVRTSVSDAAAGAGLVQLAAPVLDCGLLAFAYRRMNQADQRIRDVDKLEQGWQDRIKAAGNELHATERRLSLVETEMSYQKKIAELHQKIAANQP